MVIYKREKLIDSGDGTSLVLCKINQLVISSYNKLKYIDHIKY